MTDSLLDGNDQTVFDDNKDYFAELVGEDKKFKDEKALAKGKAFSDHHISILEREKAELLEDYRKTREELNKRAAIEELIDQMKNTASNERTPTVNPDDNKPSFDPEELDRRIDEGFEKKTRQQREAANFQAVQDKLRERHGDNFSRVVSAQLKEFGLSDEDAVALAKKSPAAFYRQFGLDQEPKTENFQTPPHTQKRSDSFVPSAGHKRTWSYYQNMRKTNPDLYHDPKTQLQKDRDYLELGKTFEDGDFNRFR